MKIVNRIFMVVIVLCVFICISVSIAFLLNLITNSDVFENLTWCSVGKVFTIFQ